MAAPEVQHLQSYRRHITSEFLKDRYPYLEDINAHLKPDDVAMAFGDRLYPRLVEQLKSPGMPAEKLCEALRTICDLCSNQENKSQAIASDAVAAATNLLAHGSVDVQRDAARAIGGLAYLIGGRFQMPMGNTQMSKAEIGTFGAGPTLPRLAKLLFHCNDELVKMNVAQAFKSVTVFRDGCQQVVDQGSVRSIAQYLCATLPDLPPSEPLSLCLLYLLQTLAAVTMYASGGMNDLFGVGLIERIVGFLAVVPQDGKLVGASAEDSVEILRQALRVLWHCGNDPRGRKEFLKAAGVKVATQYLVAGDAKVREAAVCALNVASLETQGKKDILQHSPVGLAALLHSGDSETPYLHETCVQLVRSASELPAFRFAFARRIVESSWLLEKIYGTCALAAISPLLRPEEDLATRRQALQVAAYFLTTKMDGDLIKVPPVCSLDDNQSPMDFALEDCVDILHDLVGLLQDAREPATMCLKAMCSAARPREELAALVSTGKLVVPEASRKDIAALTGVC
uniref:Armadillo repeat-containing protein 8 n=1 Tax=Zooxanthella nutricula TaxID=1333877 RepID=A0A7S2PBY5_9DINO